MPLLRGEFLDGREDPLAHRLSGREQFMAGAGGERVGTDLAERVMGVAQLPARVQGPMLAA